jgi:DNA-binding transcriptional MerR regulator
MKIHELAKKTGLTAPTIRFYEQEGLLDSRYVRRRENNYRDYSEEAIEYLLIIKEARAAGFALAEVKELDKHCHGDDLDSLEVTAVLRRKMAEVSEKIAALERAQTYLASKLTEIHQRERAF